MLNRQKTKLLDETVEKPELRRERDKNEMGEASPPLNLGGE